MAKFLKTIAAIVISALALTSCGKSLLIEEAPTPEPQKGPVGYMPVGENLVDVIFDDGSKVEAEYEFTLTAQDTIKVAGREPIKAAEELSKQAAEELVFAYNYGISDTVKANIVVNYIYNDKSYQLRCLEPEMMTVSGTHSTKEEVTSPAYYELSETIYVLDFAGIELASATQVFEVEEGYVPPTVDHIEWGAEHIAFRREAQMQGGLVNIFCDNLFWAAQRMTDGTLRNEVEVPYVGINTFEASIPELIKVEDVAAVSDSTFYFEGNVADICGYELAFIPSAWEIEGEVTYDGIDFASELDTCYIYPRTITFYSADSAVVKFYNDDPEDYAELSISILVVEKENPLDHVEWGTRHEAFRREAAYADGIAIATCNNLFSAVQIMSDGSRQNAEEIPYNCELNFKVSGSDAIEVNDLTATIGKEFSFVGNTVTIGNGQVVVNFNSSSVVGKVMYQGKDYASEITPCQAKPWVLIPTSSTSAIVRVYNGKSSDYAEFVIPMNITEERRIVRTDDSYSHVAFRRNAEVAGATIAVTCDNEASFVDNYSDGTTESENVNYNVVNNFSYVVPKLVVNNIANLLGKSYNFNAGTAVVEGVNVSVKFTSREVSAIMHNGKDYRSNAPQCEVEAKTLTITSATTAVVRFYDNNAADYSEAMLSITVEEQATVVDVERGYAHLAFNQNAVVANNTISVICNNKATETKTWSNGTTSKASVDYTVTNRFVYTMSRMPVSVKGQTFRFNAGTAVVEGRNVNVNFSSREVSAIMFDGVDYRAEAPVCEVNVATITFGDKTATITFEKGNETIVAVVPVDYLEGEVVVGEIVGMWITDAYQGRILKSTDLHILARQADGSYVAYSREIGEMSFTTTKLSAAEGNSVLASGKALAWAYTPAGGRVLSLVDYIQSSKEQTGYVIDYIDFNGQVLIALGDAEAALNGVPFAEPVKAIGAMAEDGMWTINYNGTTYYFVSRN